MTSRSPAIPQFVRRLIEHPSRLKFPRRLSGDSQTKRVAFKSSCDPHMRSPSIVIAHRLSLPIATRHDLEGYQQILPINHEA